MIVRNYFTPGPGISKRSYEELEEPRAKRLRVGDMSDNIDRRISLAGEGIFKISDLQIIHNFRIYREVRESSVLSE